MHHITFAMGLFCLPILACLSASAIAEEAKPSAAASYLGFVGTYTGEKSQGIYAIRLDLASGRCELIGLAAPAKNPSFLAIHPNRKFLYAVNEIDDFSGKPVGGVSAFAIDPQSGRLALLNQQPSQGAGPCHLVVDKTGQCVLVANYGGGSVTALPIDVDGRLRPATSSIQHVGNSVDPARQKEPHAHSINVAPDNRFAIAADLGLDKLLCYRLDPSSGKLSANDPPATSVRPGSGPRHFAFHSTGKFAYAINEILCTITAFSYDPKSGQLVELQTLSTLPESVALRPEYSTAEVQVHPSGKYVYGSNRGHDSIAIFAVDQNRGTLREIGHQSTLGKTPRGFGIDPTGQFLLAGNQDSHTIQVFRIDEPTGLLNFTGQSLQVGSPVCVKFLAP